MNKNKDNEEFEAYLTGPPIADDATVRNILAGMDEHQAAQENLSKIEYKGYLGAQTKAQAAVPLIQSVPQISAKQIPTVPKLQAYQKFHATTPEQPEQPETPKTPPISPTDFLNIIRGNLAQTIQAAKDEPKPEYKKTNQLHEKILETRFRYNPDYNYPPSILRMNGERFATLEGISLIGGKQKSGKTQLISAIATAYLTGTEICGCLGFAPPERPELVWIDTEQSPGDLNMVLKRAELACNERERENLIVYHLRDFRDAELIHALRGAIQLHPRAALVMIDHIGDACPNPNDIGPVKKLVHDLHALAKAHNIHLLLTMHMNKYTKFQGNDANANAGFEGWLGKEIQKKAETTACVYKEKDSDLRVVECTDARGKDFNSFQFRITAQDELPQKLDQTMIPGAKPGQRATLTMQPNEMADTTHTESIHQVFSDGRALTYQDLFTRLKMELTARTGKTCTDALARAYKEHWAMRNLITMEGTPNTRSCRYTPADSGWERKPLIVVPSGNDLEKEAAALFPGIQPKQPATKTKRKRKHS
jgi:hypothetical protein